MENNLILILIVVFVSLACSVLFGIVFQGEAFYTAVCSSLLIAICTATYYFMEGDEERND